MGSSPSSGDDPIGFTKISRRDRPPTTSLVIVPTYTTNDLTLYAEAEVDPGFTVPPVAPGEVTTTPRRGDRTEIEEPFFCTNATRTV
jgi:hypothetical protein